MLERPTFHRLFARAGSAVDGAAIRVMQVAIRRSAPRRRSVQRVHDLMAKLDTYAQPDLIADPTRFYLPPEPVRVSATFQQDLPHGGAVVDLTFPSRYQPYLASYRDEHFGHAENLTVHARWFRSMRPRTTLICLHGMGGGPFFFEEQAFAVRALYRAGLDLVLLQLPFHGNRRPRRAPLVSALFPSSHLVRTNEAFGQTVWDIRTLVRWLHDQDASQVGLFGMSLGGYVAALMASLDDDLAFSVPMIPAVSIADLMWRHGKKDRTRRHAEEAGLTKELVEQAFRIHGPLARPAQLPTDRLFIIAGRADRITPPAHAETLWDHWGRPELVWFPGGHLAQIGRGEAFRALLSWLGRHDLLRPHGRKRR